MRTQIPYLFDLPHNIRLLHSINCLAMIDKLSHWLEEIEIGFVFDTEIQNLPSSIRKLSFHASSKYNRDIVLPLGLEELVTSKCYNKRIWSMPLRLKKVTCSWNYDYIEDFISRWIEVKLCW